MVRFVLKIQILAITIQLFKKVFYFSVNVLSTKALIGDTIFTSPTGDGTAILRCHAWSSEPREGLAGQRQYLHFSVIL